LILPYLLCLNLVAQMRALGIALSSETHMPNIQIRAMRVIINAVLSSIDAAGDLGAPSGALYAALQAQGASLSQFQRIMGELGTMGLVTQFAETYTLTDRGCEQLRSMTASAK